METDEVCDRPLETFGALLHSLFFIVALIVCVPFVPQATTKIKLHGSVRAEGVKGATGKPPCRLRRGETLCNIKGTTAQFVGSAGDAFSAICFLQKSRFTSSKPSISAIASDKKCIRHRTNSFVRYCLRAIPHKERTAKRSGKRYNKEVKKQLTMSLISDELGQASTKKKEFLGIMEKLIPWSEWVGIVQPHYYKGERGNKPYDLELMLRIYVLQHLYNLADDAARNEIIDSRAFSQFCGVDSSNQVPDGDTIGRFRHILERNQLGEAFFTNVVESLQKCNLMLKKGTIVDSTLIAAPSSTKNKEKQRDPEAHSVKKGNQWYFGYKEHIGVDADSGLVHTVETTSANVHDSNMVAELLQGTEEEIYGDSGYLGAEKRDDAVLVNNEGKPIRYQINKRPSQLKKASGEKFELLKAIEHAKSSVRSKVEHVFCVIKRIFHFCKTRYRGRKKLHQHCCTLFALANLYLARNRMKVA